MSEYTLEECLDVPGFLSIEGACFENPWREDSFAGGPNSLAFGFWRGEEPAAFVYGRQVLDEVELWRIATHPKHRRQGLAAGLLAAFADRARQRGAAYIFLEVASRNLEAIRSYQRAGFRETGRRKAYYKDGDDALTMTLDL